MERVQERDELGQGNQVPSLAPFPPEATPVDLEALVATARSTPGQAGRDAHRQLNEVLTSLTPTEEHGKRLIKLLDQGAFNDLRADDGSQTRELAVETLLRLGYPWAIQIHPDELVWYRQLAFLRKRNRWLRLLGIFGVGAIAEAFLLRLF